ncbi:MAG: FecR domain-containing protein [Geminicoccaceae bacterium]
MRIHELFRHLAALVIVSAGLALSASAGAEPEWIYAVRPGDTLLELSRTYLKEDHYWRRLKEHNAIDDVYRIPPGTKLRIPVHLLRTQPAPAQLVGASGEVTVRPADGQGPSPGLGNRALEAGDVVVTGANSTADVRFADGSRLIVAPNSEIVMDRLSAYENTGMVDTTIRLQRGRVDSVVPAEAVDRPFYQIETPHVVSAARGTRFRVASDDRASRTEVLDGDVRASGSGVVRSVAAGFGTIARAGEPPEPPRPLLPAPVLDPAPERLDRVPVVLPAPALPGAESFRLRIAPADAPDRIVFDAVRQGERLSGPVLDDRDWLVRLRGLDADGIEGRETAFTVELDARPEPPSTIAPPLDGKVRERRPTFRWAEPAETTSYHIQIAADDRFAAPVIDADGVQGGSFVPAQDLPEGDWFWRVRRTDSRGDVGPFGDPQPFVRENPPPNPKAELPDTEARNQPWVFSWRDAGEGVRYRVQLARNERFRPVVVDEIVTTPAITIEPLASTGTHYLRIATITEDGYQAPYGAAQRFDIPSKAYWTFAIPALLGLLLLL